MNLINKNLYELTDSEFIRFVKMPWAEFIRRAKTCNVVEALNRRRALQAAMTRYSQRREVDGITMTALRMTMKLERMAMLTFMYYQMKQLFKQHPTWTKAARKIEAKRQWEQFIKLNSF